MFHHMHLSLKQCARPIVDVEAAVLAIPGFSDHRAILAVVEDFGSGEQSAQSCTGDSFRIDYMLQGRRLPKQATMLSNEAIHHLCVVNVCSL
jgi:hypothetical protein